MSVARTPPFSAAATRCRSGPTTKTLSNRLRSTLWRSRYAATAAALSMSPVGRSAVAARMAFCSETILADTTRPMRSALATSASSTARWLRCSIARSTSTTVSATLAAISTKLARAKRNLSEPAR